jgi:hypothetical protein
MIRRDLDAMAEIDGIQEKMHTPYEKMHTPPIFCTPLYKSLSEGMVQGKIPRRKCAFLVSANPCNTAAFMKKCEKALFQAIFGHKTRTLILIFTVSKLAFLYGGERGI